MCPPTAMEKDLRPISLICTVRPRRALLAPDFYPRLRVDPRLYARKGHSTPGMLFYTSDTRRWTMVRHVIGSFSLISLRDLILLTTLFEFNNWTNWKSILYSCGGSLLFWQAVSRLYGLEKRCQTGKHWKEEYPKGPSWVLFSLQFTVLPLISTISP